MYYEFVIQNGTIEKDTLKLKLKMTIEAGGGPGLTGEAAEAIGKYYGVPISSEEAEAVSRKLAEQVTGRGWKAAADLIVTTRSAENGKRSARCQR